MLFRNLDVSTQAAQSVGNLKIKETLDLSCSLCVFIHWGSFWAIRVIFIDFCDLRCHIFSSQITKIAQKLPQ